MSTQLAWKVLTSEGAAHHGGVGRWNLPNGVPGKWKTVRGDLVACKNGLHLCRREHLIYWLGPTIFIAEYEGEPVHAGNKIVVCRARLVERIETWNERTARLFAADCAERSLRLLAKRRMTVDGRSKAAVKAVRDFANGKIGSEELAAAWYAARDAAWGAEGDVAGAAAWGAEGDVAGAAAWYAAEAAAWDAAGDAAGAAAWYAARDAAGAAAWDVAWDAERKWQTSRLFDYLDGRRGQ